MLEKIEALKVSIRQENQYDEIRLILGDDLYMLLLEVLFSASESDAESRVGKFSDELHKHPMKAFKLYGKLTLQQREIISSFTEE